MSNIEFKDGYIVPLEQNTQVDGEITSMELPVVSNDYKLKRALSYPSIGDQLDDLFHLGFFSEEMTAKIQAIKDKYPKN